jgi:hypothetical protein
MVEFLKDEGDLTVLSGHIGDAEKSSLASREQEQQDGSEGTSTVTP